jgi:GTP pyrophosphokinase
MQTTLQKINDIYRNYARTPIDALTSAYEYIVQAVKGEACVKACFEKSIAMLYHLIHLEPDGQAMLVTFLYPIYEQHLLPLDSLKKQFNKVELKLLRDIESMRFIESFQAKTTSFTEKNKQFNNLRKMLLAMVDDARVVVIKLVERLVFLESLRMTDPSTKKQAAQLIEKIYAPLANCLGVGQLKWQLEDFAFRYRDKENYLKIAKALNMRRRDREVYIESILHKLRQLLTHANIKRFSISGRAKHILSIYRKIQRKHVDLNEIYDASAVRILVEDVSACYEVLSLIHETWIPIPKEFDDYIANPKPNGYQSIHTAVIGPEDRHIEIQIRTYVMHQHSELGVAAHWAYKEANASKKAISRDDAKINYLRQMIHWQQEVDQAYPSVSIQSIFNDRVYVFTPNDDVIDLPRGSTPIDLAYAIHTHVGHHCRGAKVNDVMVPLTYQLKTGDHVEILVSKTTTPSRDWLKADAGYLATSSARSKVQHYFKHEHDEENFDLGSDIWHKFCKRYHLNKNLIEEVFDAFAYKTRRHLLIALGNNDIHVRSIFTALKQKGLVEAEVEPKAAKVTTVENIKTSCARSNVVIDGAHGLVTQTARCCKPIPGDTIVGYITRNRGISVHKKNCRNVEALQRLNPHRFIDINWDNSPRTHYPVDVIILAENDERILNEIIHLVSNEKIPLLNLNSQIMRMKNQLMIQMTLSVSHQEALNAILQKLQQMSQIIKVYRKE